MINDQAQRLRDFVSENEVINKIDNSSGGPKVISISSGKGGVGKSNFTTNLAIELKKRGNRVIIIDADFGLANVEILFGVISKKNFLDLMNNNVSIKDIITDVNGIGLISGGSGIVELSNVSDVSLNKVINSIEQLKDMADYILIDTGAGISKVVTAFSNIAHEIVVVTTCEPTSVADAYALIKSLVSKDKNIVINIVINRAENISEANTIFNNINGVSQKFINKNLNYLGFIYDDEHVYKAVKNQVAFVELFPNSRATKCICKICDNFTNADSNAGKLGFESFINKFRKLFR